MKIEELEATLLDQIEKLNQDDIMDKPEEADRLIARSKAMSDLTDNIIEIQKVKIDAQRVKIEAVKIVQDACGLGYENYLGIEADKKK
jgi:hypothetical protein